MMVYLKGESSNVLDLHLRLGSGSMSKEVDSSRGLRRGDGVAIMEVPGHAVELAMDPWIECDQLFECVSQ
jgi:hypothetical protein